MVPAQRGAGEQGAAPVGAALELGTGARPAPRIAQPTVATAVAAAGGFVVGAATMAMLRRHGQPRLVQGPMAVSLERQLAPGSRTYLVHVRRLA